MVEFLIYGLCVILLLIAILYVYLCIKITVTQKFLEKEIEITQYQKELYMKILGKDITHKKKMNIINMTIDIFSSYRDNSHLNF